MIIEKKLHVNQHLIMNMCKQKYSAENQMTEPSILERKKQQNNKEHTDTSLQPHP